MKTLMLLCSLFTVVPAATLTGKVVGVKSGNSLEILQDGKVLAVKIHGIECPAKSFAAGKAARKYVATNAFMNNVRVEITGTESDGILIGKVILENGLDIATELVKAGLAWWDKRKSPDEVGLAQLEKSVREDYVGIWAGAQADDDDQDFGKEVLAQRELVKDNTNSTTLLTSANN